VDAAADWKDRSTECFTGGKWRPENLRKNFQNPTDANKYFVKAGHK